MVEKEYIIFCDESDKRGKYYSNFYGGVLVGATQYQRITQRLNDRKQELQLHGEIKWEKVTERYLPKYEAIIQCFFEEVIAGHLKVRIMFTQNAYLPQGLTKEHLEHEYFLLYYQFVKHAFGLRYIQPVPEGINLRLYFDQFPDTGEKVEQFKGFLLGLAENKEFRRVGVRILKEDVAEIVSHDHVLLQCLDIVLGSMTFRLNDKHKEKPEGQRIRGKRTRAKEKLYKTILREIRKIYPFFNIGLSTGTPHYPIDRWDHPYRHWLFTPSAAQFDPMFTKK